MRVLFCCLPAHGHLNPMLPLATSLRDAGHDVRFGTGTGFVDRIRALGFATEPVGISIGEATQQTARAHPELVDGPPEERWRLGVLTFAEAAADATTADLLPLLAEHRPDVVVYEETQFGAAVAARMAGVPAVCHSLSRQMPEPLYRYGLSVVASVWTDHGGRGAMPDLFHENPYLDICPPSLRDPAAVEPRTRLSLRPVAQTEPGAGLPAWVTGGRNRPLVYLTFGTYVYHAVDALRAAALGLSRLDADVLVTVGPDGDPAALGELPDNVRVERYVPQDRLLSFVDLVVHHGGSGTLFGSLALGLPQLVLPHGADQFVNAEVVAANGVGLTLAPDAINPDAVANRAAILMRDKTFREAAESVAREIADMPDPAEVAAQLPSLV
jgi:UDP:flavonoid glycosyltransferase YjiC (YdhE family)